jgi:hypothetical protein
VWHREIAQTNVETTQTRRSTMPPIDASSGPDLLSDAEVAHAVQRNAAFSTSTWPGFFDAICSYYLRFRTQSPGPEEFAQAVARWQQAVGGGQMVDGILGPGTWAKMRGRGEPDTFTSMGGTDRPRGRPEVLATFGNPDDAGFAASQMVAAAPPAGFTLSVTVQSGIAHPSSLSVHQLLKDDFEDVLAAIATAGLWDAVMPLGGTFNPRPIGSTSLASMHSFGIAIDLNPAAFPQGQLTNVPDPTIVGIFQDQGFHWGAFFNTPDPMHFQFATGA